MSIRAAAQRFGFTKSAIAFWVSRSQGQRLDRFDFADGKPGRAWNRTPIGLEARIVQLRKSLQKSSILGEYGARAIQNELEAQIGRARPSEATINRVLARHGLQESTRRVRRPPPPRGWYLPEVATGSAELDCFDFIEDLKIADGPLVNVLTGKSLHGALSYASVHLKKSAQHTAICLEKRWEQDGLPAYAQFDNDTVFQGAHQFPNTVGRVSRLCLQLGVIPVFAPPLEHGMQNIIESFNALWQAKVWQRHRVRSMRELQRYSERYIAAHRAHTWRAREASPPRRPMPKRFRLDLNAPLRGLMIFIRRTNERGCIRMLGQSYAVTTAWPHRLVRCEVDFDHHWIRCYALRRRAPLEQPLLASIPYKRPDKPFKGQL